MSDNKYALISDYISNLDSNIYCIYGLPPEIISVLLAYVSRNPNSFKDNLIKLISDQSLSLKPAARDQIENINQSSNPKTGTDKFEKAIKTSREFHEKWVINYGHSSVAEHSIIHFAVEDISILATKVIEDNRLASYSEKSTRYQVFNKNKFYYPESLMSSKYSDQIKDTIDLLFNEYNEFYDEVYNYISNKFENSNLSKSALKSKTCDVIRYFLPAGTLTTLAATMNARSAAYCIQKLKSHSLLEMNQIGEKMLNEGLKICPTLLKYTDSNKYINQINSPIHSNISIIDYNSQIQSNSVTIIDFTNQIEDKLISSILFKYSNISYQRAFEKAKLLTNQQRLDIINYFFNNRTDHDPALRELEHIYYTMEIVVDYGAFRDIQRHRISTQSSQLFTTSLGYETPDIINKLDSKYLERYNRAMEKALNTYALISQEFPL